MFRWTLSIFYLKNVAIIRLNNNKLFYVIKYFKIIVLIFCLDEPDKIKKEAFQIKLNEYTKRAEELKATLYVSKIKISSEEKAENSSISYDDDHYPTLSKNIFKIEIIYQPSTTWPNLRITNSIQCFTRFPIH